MGRATYPSRARLRHRGQFQRVLSRGRLHAGRECVVRVLENDVGHARLGIAAPRRYGKAVVRNRFKRLVREAFRELQEELGGLDLFVAPRRGLAEPTLSGLRADLAAAPACARPPGPRRGRGKDGS